MFKSLKKLISRWKLSQKGLYNGKPRRKLKAKDSANNLQTSLIVKAGLYLGFISFMMYLFSCCDKLNTAITTNHTLIYFSLICACLLSLEINFKKLATDNQKLLLILLIISLQIGLYKYIYLFIEVKELNSSYLFLCLPFALAPITLTLLIGKKVGFYVAITSSLISSFMLGTGSINQPILVTGLIIGFTVSILASRIRSRYQLLKLGLFLGILILILGSIFQTIIFSVWQLNNWQQDSSQILNLILCALINGLLTSMIITPLLPLLEQYFGTTSVLGWLELSDLKHPLLKRLQLEAAGTFQHSMLVATLSEAAAQSIGANDMLCRTASYFHDIGKLEKPEYFVENQSQDSINPHDNLTPSMSALIIIAHVKDGIDLGVKYKIKPAIIEIIEQHHGTSLVRYFYFKALEQQKKIKEDIENGLANEQELPEVNKHNFSYPNRKPQSQEAAIVMIADSVESASRSLKKPTKKKLRSLIDEIVLEKINDQQFNECNLSFPQLEEIKKALYKTLSSILHHRISYPTTKAVQNKKPSKNPSKKTDS